MEHDLALKHVPEKLIDFFDQNMLQLFEFERFFPDQMIPSDREAELAPGADPVKREGRSARRAIGESGQQPQKDERRLDP